MQVPKSMNPLWGLKRVCYTVCDSLQCRSQKHESSLGIETTKCANLYRCWHRSQKHESSLGIETYYQVFNLHEWCSQKHESSLGIETDQMDTEWRCSWLFPKA